jgi:hypothetical protein
VRQVYVILSLVLVVGGELQATDAFAQSALPLLVISQQQKPAGRVEFTLRNDGPRTVVAWEVRARVTYPDGTVAEPNRLSTDSYVSVAGITPIGYHLAPGATVTREFGVSIRPEVAPTSVEVYPTGAVFDDKSAVGDPAFAAFVFEERQRDRQAWMDILDTLEAASKSAGMTPRALAAALDRLASTKTADRDHLGKQTVRTNLRLAQRDVTLGRATAESRLNAMIQEARQRVAVATEASRVP